MKRNILNESLCDLRSMRRILREAYGDDMMGGDPRMMQQQGGGEDMMGGDEDMEQDPRMMQQQAQGQKDPRKMTNSERMDASMNSEQMDEDGEESPIANDGEMKNIIDQIRELAIQGIAQYSENVEDPRYQSLKRIWMETDKFYESFMTDEKKGK